jgi:hypothetical protein
MSGAFLSEVVWVVEMAKQTNGLPCVRRRNPFMSFSERWKMRKRTLLCGAAVFGLAATARAAIFQTLSPYTDTQGDEVGSTNKLRDIWSATVSNDASNLIFTINFNPAADLSAGGAFNYGIGITTGSPTAGGDTSANATTHGNPYDRTISIDSSLGGMMDWIGIFGNSAAGANGSASKPFLNYGFNDYVFGTPGSTEPAGVWTVIDTVGSGQPISPQSGGTTNSSVTVTVPMADFASNLPLTVGTTFDFDIYSTGTSAGQTAYDSLADQSATNGSGNGGGSPTTQYNGTVLDSYTIAAPVPDPATLSLLACGGLLVLKRRSKN